MENIKKINRWKVTAMIFIALFIIESIFLLWAYNLGTSMIEKEQECIYNVCIDAETYYYNEYQEICECYINNELVNSKYLG